MFDEQHHRSENSDHPESHAAQGHDHEPLAPEGVGADVGGPSGADDSVSLLDRMEGELRKLRSHVAERTTKALELEARREELERREAELQELERKTDHREAELEEAQHRLTSEREQLAGEAQRAEERARQLEQQASELEEARRRFGEHEQGVEARARELEQRSGELERQREGLELRAAEIEARECSLSSEHEEVTRLRSEVDSLRAELSKTRGKLAEAGRHLAENKPGDDAELNRLQGECEALHAELAAVRAELEQTGQRLAENAATPDRSEEIDRLEAQAATFRAQLEATRAELAETQNRLEAASAAGAAAGAETPSAFVAKRRERLELYKKLLRDRAEKVAQVKDTLKRRQKELQKAQEQIAAKQKDVESARETRDQAERLMVEAQDRSAEAARLIRRAEMRATKGKASVFIAGLMASLLIATASAWFGVSRFVPATYMASARIGIDTRDIDPSSRQIESWRDFVAELPADPQFLERASERLRMRGFDEIGNPTDLKRHLETNLELSSANPEEISLLLRGEGAGRTERELDTFVTAVVAYANDTKMLRADQSSTAMVQRAAADAAPIEDPRLAAFGIAAGAGCGLVLILTVIAWRSLRNTVAKRAENPDANTGFDESAMLTEV